MTHPDSTVLERGRLLFTRITLAYLDLLDTLWSQLRTRWRQARATGDAGSETVEKAVIVAAMLGLAVGLAAVINAVVNNYQGQITP